MRGREAMRREVEAQLPSGRVFPGKVSDASAFFQNLFHQERLQKEKSGFLEHQGWKRPCSSQMGTAGREVDNPKAKRSLRKS